jgi:hypothetical protein
LCQTELRCIKQDYSTTGKPFYLAFNENTITPNMTAYHGFRSIVPTTPAAIIELGFMGQDREILTRHPDELAQGLRMACRFSFKGDCVLSFDIRTGPISNTVGCVSSCGNPIRAIAFIILLQSTFAT